MQQLIYLIYKSDSTPAFFSLNTTFEHTCITSNLYTQNLKCIIVIPGYCIYVYKMLLPKVLGKAQRFIFNHLQEQVITYFLLLLLLHKPKRLWYRNLNWQWNTHTHTHREMHSLHIADRDADWCWNQCELQSSVHLFLNAACALTKLFSQLQSAV